MKTRCTNENQESAHNYVLRGITICERWMNSFQNFFSDMGPRLPHYTIERIDNNGNYEPGNCRWATQKEQANNSRKNRIIEHGGLRLTVAQWSDRLGIDGQLIYGRIHQGITDPSRLLFNGILKRQTKNT